MNGDYGCLFIHDSQDCSGALASEEDANDGDFFCFFICDLSFLGVLHIRAAVLD